MSETNTPLHDSDNISESTLSSEKENLTQIDNQENNINKSMPENEQKSRQPSQEFIENTDWYAIACKIRKSNRQLVNKIMELETTIVDYENRLKIQHRRCLSAENLIEQQTEELQNSQEEIVELYKQLDNLHQEFKKKELSLQSVSEQLQKSEEQVARVERECSLLQDNYDQQKRQLLVAEKQNRELEVRLQRQMNYTLEFKVALEQCLKAPSLDNLNEIEHNLLGQTRQIEPWSKSKSENLDSLINTNLHQKLLSTQAINTDFQEEENINISQEEIFFDEENMETFFHEKILFDKENIDINFDENIMTNEDEESLILNEDEENLVVENNEDEQDENINVSLPFTDINSSEDTIVIEEKQPNSSPSLLLEKETLEETIKKKKTLKLPDFL